MKNWMQQLTITKKVLIITELTIFLLLGEGIFFTYSIHQQRNKQIHLMGTLVPVLTSKHVPFGTQITYTSNPPSSGEHYGEVNGVETAHAGIYDMKNIPVDGFLVHNLEHGAIILWYNPNDLSKEQITNLKFIFKSISLEKKIMTPRNNLPVPISLSSWGRILNLQTIDKTKIKLFFETNYDNGPEQAAI